jgi:hypothetical protein
MIFNWSTHKNAHSDHLEKTAWIQSAGTFGSGQLFLTFRPQRPPFKIFSSTGSDIGWRGLIATLADVMVLKGVPEHLRSDNGPEFVARDLRKWL